MNTTNNKWTSIFLGAIAGFFISWIVFANNTSLHPREGMHMMPDGTMMRDMHPMMHSDMSMGGMMDVMTKNLQGKTGIEFDKAFLTEMIPHHQGAVVMAEMVLKTSKNPELIKLANDIIIAQNKEIEMMQKWLQEIK